MTLTRRLRLLLLGALLVGLCGAGLALWCLREARESVERIDLAHRTHEAHLELASHTYRLFKQYGDALIIGDNDNGAGERELIGMVRQDIGRIRRLIGSEIDTDGASEIADLRALSRLDFKIEQLIATFERLTGEGRDETLSDNWLRLSHILNAEIDRDFRALIEDAVAESSADVARIKREVGADLDLYTTLAGLFASLALVAGATTWWILRRWIREPMARLRDGVRRFARGDLDHRLDMAGTDELREIGDAFDAMAERLLAKQRRLSSRNTVLEATVDERARQLERLLEAAQTAERNRRQLLADVSHELRTPLTVIHGEADIALRGGDKSTEAYREALRRARDAAHHTAHLVDDLLFVARSESGTVRLSPAEIDLAAEIDDLLATFPHDVAVALPTEDARVVGDAARLRQAVLILLENARHHAGGKVTLALETGAKGLRVIVTDDGPGMTEEEKASAFERFYRGPDAATRYVEGTGLGLPVALAIAEAHGGTVTLEDRTGHGAGDEAGDAAGGGLVATIHLPRSKRLMAVA